MTKSSAAEPGVMRELSPAALQRLTESARKEREKEPQLTNG
jgi:hypothetical protein